MLCAKNMEAGVWSTWRSACFFFFFLFHLVLLVLEALVVLRVHGALDGAHLGGAEFLGLAHGCDFLTHAAAGVTQCLC